MAWLILQHMQCKWNGHNPLHLAVSLRPLSWFLLCHTSAWTAWVRSLPQCFWNKCVSDHFAVKRWILQKGKTQFWLIKLPPPGVIRWSLLRKCSEHSCGPLLDSLQQIQVFPVPQQNCCNNFKFQKGEKIQFFYFIQGINVVLWDVPLIGPHGYTRRTSFYSLRSKNYKDVQNTYTRKAFKLKD